MKLPHLASSLAALSLALSACVSSTSTAPLTTRTYEHDSRAVAVAPASGSAPAAAAPAQLAATPEQVVERILALEASESHVDEYLRALCVDIGPRLTSSTQLHKACEWTRDQFASLGLVARLEQWGEFPVGFDRGPWRGGMVAPSKLDFEFNTFAWTPGTHGAARGKALPFPTSEEQLAALREHIPGAWLVRPPANELKDADGNVLFEKPPQPSNELIEKVQDAIVELGGLGELRGARSDLLLTDGNSRIAWDELPKLVQIRVRKEHHDQLWRELAGGAPVELEFDIQNTFVQGPRPQYNVVADLVGASKPDEFVIVCGHLDSWDGAQGTVDNGTGCATTLEAARLLVRAGAKPERTIRFILWSGEEQGLFGSEGYVRDHAGELAKVSAVLNHDGGTNYLSGLRCSAQMEPQLRVACAALFGLAPEMPFELKPNAEGMQVSPDSDHWPFFKAGVPGFFWEQAGRSNYNKYHHTQYDTLDAAIPEYQRHSAVVAAVSAFGLSNLPELLDRTNMKAPEPRRMGVRLEGNKIASVSEGRAKSAGLLAGDVVLAIDGHTVKTQAGISNEVSKGAPRKLFQIQRGEQTLEVALDWSDDPDEPRRVEAAQRRAEREAQRKAEADAAKAEAAAKKAAESTTSATEGSKP